MRARPRSRHSSCIRAASACALAPRAATSVSKVHAKPSLLGDAASNMAINVVSAMKLLVCVELCRLMTRVLCLADELVVGSYGRSRDRRFLLHERYGRTGSTSEYRPAVELSAHGDEHEKHSSLLRSRHCALEHRGGEILTLRHNAITAHNARRQAGRHVLCQARGFPAGLARRPDLAQLPGAAALAGRPLLCNVARAWTSRERHSRLF